MADPLRQAETTSPATTGVMAILTVKPRRHARAGDAHHAQGSPADRATLSQWQIREWYSRGDGRGAIFVLDTRDVEEASAIMDDLPLAKEDLIDHEYIPVGPLFPLRLLMSAS